MAASAVVLCNQALAHIGVTQRVTALSGSDNVSVNCNLFYEQCRDSALEAHRWQFAKKVAALAQIDPDVTEPPPGWSFMYTYPTDCLMPRMIYTEDGLRHQNSWLDPDSRLLLAPKYPYELQQHPTTDATVLVCDVEDAYLEYTVRVSNTTRFTPAFDAALSYLLASKLGPALRADAKLTQSAWQFYQYMIGQAHANNMNAQQPDPTPDSVSIAIRG